MGRRRGRLVRAALPSSPPRHQSSPCNVIAHAWSYPPLITTARSASGTCVGTSRDTKSPWPSCPSSLAPQQNTSPSRVRAQVLSARPLTSTQKRAGSMRSGMSALGPGRPSCPSAFDPKHHSSPSPRTAHVCVLAAAMRRPYSAAPASIGASTAASNAASIPASGPTSIGSPLNVGSSSTQPTSRTKSQARVIGAPRSRCERAFEARRHRSDDRHHPTQRPR